MYEENLGKKIYSYTLLQKQNTTRTPLKNKKQRKEKIKDKTVDCDENWARKTKEKNEEHNWIPSSRNEAEKGESTV